MAESSDTPPASINDNNSNFITKIHPATQLGGRGTPRRKTRRPNNSNHSSLIAARTIENKLKPFRTQFQLHDQQELCDVTILYEDGHVDIQKQVHVHSTWPMTIHEIDSSDKGTQTYHIDDLDSTTYAYLLGNDDKSQNESDKQPIPLTTTTSVSNYYNDLQQRQHYYQSSPYYMNYSIFKQNPYVYNSSFDVYSNNIREVYGGANEQSDDDEDKEEEHSIPTKSKRRRRRRKHPKTISEQSSSIIPKQQENVTVEKPIEHLENEDIITTKPKRKRRRIRKSKISLPSSSITGEQAQSSTVIEHSEVNALFSLTDEKTTENIPSSSSSSPTSIQHAEPYSSYFELKETQQLMSTKNAMHENSNSFTENVMNVLKNGEKKKEKEGIQPTNSSARTADTPIDDDTTTILTHTTSTIVDVAKKDDENKKTTLPATHDAIIPTTYKNTISPVIIIKDHDDITSVHRVSVENQRNIDEFIIQQQISQEQTLSDHIQVNILCVFLKFLVSVN
jgi:hypothetical protein